MLKFLSRQWTWSYIQFNLSTWHDPKNNTSQKLCDGFQCEVFIHTQSMCLTTWTSSDQGAKLWNIFQQRKQTHLYLCEALSQREPIGNWLDRVQEEELRILIAGFNHIHSSESWVWQLYQKLEIASNPVKFHLLEEVRNGKHYFVQLWISHLT